MALAGYAKRRLEEAGVPPLYPDKTTFKEFAVDVGRNAADVVREARASGVNPGYALGRDYPGLENALLVAVTEKRTVEEIDRLAGVLAQLTARDEVGAAQVGATQVGAAQ
jgi:glycine dehydrogenase subunit 1